MPSSKTPDKQERLRLIEELSNKFSDSTQQRRKNLSARKKYFWLFVVTSTKALKRFIDISFSLFLLIVLSPLMLLVAILIKITDGGDILYITNRVGKWGQEFSFPKFRSMKPGAELQKSNLKSDNVDEKEDGSEITFKMRKDPRITWIGSFIRKFSIDELPQLWCVLKGEMSLVGPRPPLPEEVAKYTAKERERLEITPGLTCLWQVSGRSDIPFARQIELDRQYIESQSFWGDIKILLKTIPAVFFGRGAY